MLLRIHILFIIQSLLIGCTIPTGGVHTVHIVDIASTINTHEVRHDIYGHREDNGAVVLSSDAVKSLEITQLKKRFFVC